MITSFSEFLLQLKTREEALLSQQQINHAPTIGDMYEGLSKTLLAKAIPSNLEISLVDGFVRGVKGQLSSQIDCMLVVGTGECIPYTDSFVWDIANVLAVFEVKKNLYSAEVSESYPKLRTIMSMFIEAWTKDIMRPIDRSAQSFALITGHFLKHADDVDDLPEGLLHIFQTIFLEQYAPLRILFGYQGFATEHALREGFLNYLESIPPGSPGYGLNSFPNQIICRQNSLVVATGHPYCPSIVDDWWPVVISSSENPLRILLELLWTKICGRFDMVMPDDDSLSVESFSPLLSAKFQKADDLAGWKYHFETLSKAQLSARKPQEWEPFVVDRVMANVLLTLNKKGAVKLNDPHHLKFIRDHHQKEDDVVDQIVKMGLGAVKDETLHALQTFAIAFLPDGRSVVAFEQDKLRLWVKKNMKEWSKNMPKNQALKDL
jgi:uncharacterized protein DUF6602